MTDDRCQTTNDRRLMTGVGCRVSGVRCQMSDDSQQSQKLYEIRFFVKDYGVGILKPWEMIMSGSKKIKGKILNPPKRIQYFVVPNND